LGVPLDCFFLFSFRHWAGRDFFFRNPSVCIDRFCVFFLKTPKVLGVPSPGDRFSNLGVSFSSSAGFPPPLVPPPLGWFFLYLVSRIFSPFDTSRACRGPVHREFQGLSPHPGLPFLGASRSFRNGWEQGVWVSFFWVFGAQGPRGVGGGGPVKGFFFSPLTPPQNGRFSFAVLATLCRLPSRHLVFCGHHAGHFFFFSVGRFELPPTFFFKPNSLFFFPFPPIPHVFFSLPAALGFKAFFFFPLFYRFFHLQRSFPFCATPS